MVAVFILGVILTLVKNHTIPFFFWAVLTFMVLNFWANEKKPDSVYLFLPWAAYIILMIIFVIRGLIFLANLTMEIVLAEPISFYGAFWNSVSGWPSLVASFIMVFYGATLLDNDIRTDLKNRLDEFFTFKKVARAS